MYQKLKRALALLLALTLALALAACGAQETEDAQETDDPLQAADAAADAADVEDPVVEPEAESAEKSITLTITYEDGTSEEFIIETEAEYLKEAIEDVVELEGTEGEYGFTVTAVNGVEADFTDGADAYWAIYVNGEYGMYSIDAQPIADGDLFGLTYEHYTG